MEVGLLESRNRLDVQEDEVGSCRELRVFDVDPGVDDRHRDPGPGRFGEIRADPRQVPGMLEQRITLVEVVAARP